MALILLGALLLVRHSVNRLAADLRDTTLELVQARDRLAATKARFAEITTQDELTGCSNERHLMDMLLQHRAMSDRGEYTFTLVVSQVDQFSDIVDAYGLARANQVLQLFASVVKAALREVDVIARLNTDKFAMVLSGAGEEDALSIINRVSSLIAQIHVDDGEGKSTDMRITASGGITTYHGSETSEELLDHAEQALAYAVAEGRDRVAGYNYVAPMLEGSEMDVTSSDSQHKIADDE